MSRRIIASIVPQGGLPTGPFLTKHGTNIWGAYALVSLTGSDSVNVGNFFRNQSDSNTRIFTAGEILDGTWESWNVYNPRAGIVEWYNQVGSGLGNFIEPASVFDLPYTDFNQVGFFTNANGKPKCKGDGTDITLYAANANPGNFTRRILAISFSPNFTLAGSAENTLFSHWRVGSDNRAWNVLTDDGYLEVWVSSDGTVTASTCLVFRSDARITAGLNSLLIDIDLSQSTLANKIRVYNGLDSGNQLAMSVDGTYSAALTAMKNAGTQHRFLCSRNASTVPYQWGDFDCEGFALWGGDLDYPPATVITDWTALVQS